MKKLIGMFSAILVSTIVLVGCQNKQNTNKETTQESVTKKTKKVESSSSSKTSSEISQSKEESKKEAVKESKEEAERDSREEAREEAKEKEEKYYLLSNEDVENFLGEFSDEYSLAETYLNEVISGLKDKKNNPDSLELLSDTIEHIKNTDFNRVEFAMVSPDTQNKVKNIMDTNKTLTAKYSIMHDEAKKAMDSETYEISPEFTQAFAEYQVTVKDVINQISRLKVAMEHEDDE